MLLGASGISNLNHLGPQEENYSRHRSRPEQHSSPITFFGIHYDSEPLHSPTAVSNTNWIFPYPQFKEFLYRRSALVPVPSITRFNCA